MAHQSARKELARMIKAGSDLPILLACDDLHRFVVEKGTPSISPQTKGTLQGYSIFLDFDELDQFLPRIFRKIDLDVDN